MYKMSREFNIHKILSYQPLQLEIENTLTVQIFTRCIESTGHVCLVVG